MITVPQTENEIFLFWVPLTMTWYICLVVNWHYNLIGADET